MRVNKGKTVIIIELIVLLSLCYFPLCYRIDSLSIRQWDEARNAVNAMEMLQNKNYIVRYYDNNPEVWEVKPPLLIWLQVISLKTFGYNELAIRFPTIVAAFLTVLLISWYFYKYHNNRYIGYLAALVLVTSQGYIDRHIARTGDHDTLLIFFITAIIFLYYEYLNNQRANNNLLFTIMVFFILGVLTKSIAALFILPGLLITTFLFNAQKRLFLNKKFYIAFVIFIACISSYYFLREKYQPGYLKIVWQEELFLRYFNTQNKFDSGTFWNYGLNFFTSRFNYWIIFLLFSIIILPFILPVEKRRFYAYLLINILAFYLVISCGSKQLWYDGPLFPLFSVMIALFIYYLFYSIYNKFHLKLSLVPLITIAISFAIFFYPSFIIMKKVSRTSEFVWDKERFAIPYFLRDSQNIKLFPYTPVNIVTDEYNAHILFYVEAINYSADKEVLSFKPDSAIQSDDLILVSQEKILNTVKAHFDYSIIKESHAAYLLKINNPNKNQIIP